MRSATTFSTSIPLVVQMQSLLIIFVNVSMATAKCPIMGSDLRTLSHRFKEREGLYLNLGAAAQCRGTVTAWHFCYGMGECEMDDKYHATFLVYRPTNKTYTSSSELSIVPESIKSVSMVCQNKSKIKCSKETLLPSEQFMVQVNDIVAVCLPAEKENQLQLISRQYNEDERTESTLHQYSEIEECEMNRIRRVNTQDITPRTYLQLHLHAEVATSKVGQIPITTDPNYSLRFKEGEWYLKVVLASTAGLMILVVFVVIMAGVALKCKQRLAGAPRHTGNTVGACNPMAHATQATTTAAMNDYAINDNVAYSVPIPNAAQCDPQLQEEHIYEIV